MNKDLTINVFVYGSLKSGFYNHFLLENALKIDNATTLDTFLMYPNINYFFPFLFKAISHEDIKKSISVKGELYKINNELLSELDILEGVSAGFYNRETIEVRTLDNIVQKAYVYIANNSLLDSNEVDILKKPLEVWSREDEACGMQYINKKNGL
ncbi:MAG: gamma-glutamylcyclotransferase family protein [Arcobacteraceae bacterium]